MFLASFTLCLAGLIEGQSALDNVGFAKGSLAGWEGEGFYLTGADRRGPSTRFAVCSSDAGSRTRKAMIRHALVVPARASAIRFSAHASYGRGCEPDQRINVMLLREDDRQVPKKVRSGQLWVPEKGMLGRWQGKSREYSWDVSDLAGQTVQIVLFDKDERANCFLYCTGFQVIMPNGGDGDSSAVAATSSYQEFAEHMLKMQKKHNLPALARYDSKRFLALSNAGEKFTSQRLRYCEAFYDLFYSHFQRFGFSLHAPQEKLMLAVFDSHAGFEAYFDRQMPFGVTGIYHPGSNRLVLYDLRGDANLVAGKNIALKKAGKLGSPVDRMRHSGTIERQFNDLAQDINLATVMHEAAHQLSFNSGMLNRGGEIPIWLAEGLACYCEATDEGDWQALGSPNPSRIDTLRQALTKGRLIPLAEMIRSDTWLQTHTLLGYAQSWSLFRLLLHERPEALRAYLTLIYPRRTADHRGTDFLQAFGPDLAVLEQRYQEHVRELVKTVPAPKPR